MSNKRILVTGGAGFIGSHLCEHLLSESSWDLTIVDDLDDFYSPQLKLDNLEMVRRKGDFRFIEADIRCSGLIKERLSGEKFDCIVHLAARAGVRPSLLDPKLYVETNVDGTLNMLELARELEVPQFIFGSSSSVYGINSKVPFSEDDPIRQPISPYAATKAAGEHLCHTYAHLYGIRCVALRFFTVYGPRQRPDLAIHKFTKLIMQGIPIPVYGDGSTQRDYTFIDDIVAGVRAAIDYQGSEFEVFNLGESETVPLNRLIELLEKALGKSAVIDRKPLQPGDVPITYADITKARKMLGYNPKTKIEKGISAFCEWYKTQAEARLS